MPRIRTMLLLIAAALVPAACATTPGPPDPESKAKKAAMRADRMAIAYGLASMGELRRAGVAGQQRLGASRTAVTSGSFENRRAARQRMRALSGIAHNHVARSDHLANLAAAASQPLPEGLERIILQNLLYFRLPALRPCCGE